jgi:hypothetical protein
MFHAYPTRFTTASRVRKSGLLIFAMLAGSRRRAGFELPQFDVHEAELSDSRHPIRLILRSVAKRSVSTDEGGPRQLKIKPCVVSLMRNRYAPEARTSFGSRPGPASFETPAAALRASGGLLRMRINTAIVAQ